jgi:hypothetical protein
MASQPGRSSRIRLADEQENVTDLPLVAPMNGGIEPSAGRCAPTEAIG